MCEHGSSKARLLLPQHLTARHRIKGSFQHPHTGKPAEGDCLELKHVQPLSDEEAAVCSPVQDYDVVCAVGLGKCAPYRWDPYMAVDPTAP